MLPFRLFGVFPRERRLRHWLWDGKQRIERAEQWKRMHSFSSSMSDEQATVGREIASESMWREDHGLPAEKLRKIHASHVPELGAFSVCVHRSDANTVSYTEVGFSEGGLQMSYAAGHPCESLVNHASFQIKFLPTQKSTTTLSRTL